MADTRKGAAGYVAECFWPGVSESEVEAAEARARESARALSSDGENVRYLGSLLFPTDEVVFFQFDAASEEAARRASELAGLPFERIVESVGVSAGLQRTPTEGSKR